MSKYSIMEDLDELRAKLAAAESRAEKEEKASLRMTSIIRSCMILLEGNEYERGNTFSQFEHRLGDSWFRSYGPNLAKTLADRARELAEVRKLTGEAADEARGVIDLLADDHDDDNECKYSAGEQAFGCFACQAQERLSDIITRLEAASKEEGKDA